MRIAVILLSLAVTVAGCSLFPPSMDEQKRYISDGKFHARPLSRRAFLEVWGPPLYEHVELSQFYPAANGNYVPAFRMNLGETPPGWDGTIVSEVGDFWAYPERGELLGFVEEDLVYREQLSTEKIHAIAKRWKFETQFKSRLELMPNAPNAR